MEIIDRQLHSVTFQTAGGIEVQRTTNPVDRTRAIEAIIDALDARHGVLLTSGYEYPGRYTRWDIGFINPPIRMTSRDRSFEIAALNQRGNVLLSAIQGALGQSPDIEDLEMDSGTDCLRGNVARPGRYFPEEERSKQPSTFSIIRILLELFHSPEDTHLGLYGAFGYDLAFQFEPIERRIESPPEQRDLVLYLADQIVVVDHGRKIAVQHEYDFCVNGSSTAGMPRDGASHPYVGQDSIDKRRDLSEGEFASLVRTAHESFRRGDLFEVVPTQTFLEPCPTPPSELFRRLRVRNPAPYAALMNLGENEYLVSASPEMYVRVDGKRVETCPISGTIARGDDAISDADQILALLSSIKEKSELTMCTDVDRNDKSRICEPGSVRVIGRRQIEMYSRVIHTVDHVEGMLRDGFDGLDAFLTHTWAVTVTGAPKLWAMRFIEQHERSRRAWYGGAIGFLGFDGNINTGLTLRTIRILGGVAQIRAGATLLIDAEPEAEERETELKAAAFLDVVRNPGGKAATDLQLSTVGQGKHVLLVDHEDSFVNTLANYLRQTGATVETIRSTPATQQFVIDRIHERRPDLVFLSPGPGQPQDFKVSAVIEAALEEGLPLFGVCLGLQALVEHFGGELAVLDFPMHGKESIIRSCGDGWLLAGLPKEFSAGRYHSLYGLRDNMPEVLRVTAESDDGIAMGIEHKTLPIAAVQFHPESIMTAKQRAGHRLIENVVRKLT